MIDPALIGLLACPCPQHAPLAVDRRQPDGLACARCGRQFPLVDGIVCLMPEPAAGAESAAT